MSGRTFQKKARKGCGEEWQRLLVLCIVSICLFANSALGEFVFDDHESIEDNPDVRPNTPLADLFQNDFWGTPLVDPESHKSYRPLTILTFRWNYQIHGLDPFGYHMVNVLLHSVVCMLLYCVLLLADVDRDTSFMAALLFTVHPIHTEAVANIVGRAEILSSIFYLLSIYSFLKFLQKSSCERIVVTDWHSLLWLTGIPSTALLAMLSKEQGITCLGVCLLYYMYVHVYKCQPSSKKWWRWYPIRFPFVTECIIPLFLLITILSMVTFRISIIQWQLPVFTVMDNPASFSASNLTKLLTYSYLGFFNFWLLLCPSQLCFDWSMESIPLLDSLTDIRNIHTVSWLCLLAAVIKFCFSGSARMAIPVYPNNAKQTTLFALILMVVPLLPASNFFFHVGFVIAERILYLPSMGFCVLVAIGIKIVQKNKVSGIQGRKYNLILMAMLVLLLVMSLKTIIRNEEWKNTETLARSGLRTNPFNPKIYVTMANSLVEKGDYQCEYYYREALRINPNYTMAWSNLGLVLLNTNRPKQAEECYQKALLIQPNHISANINMGHLCRLQSRWKEALKYFSIASNRRPNQSVLHYYIGLVYMEMSNFEQAEMKFKGALNLNSNYPEAHFALGKLLSSTGVRNTKKAISHYRNGLQLSPNIEEGHLKLAMLLMDQETYAEAENQLLLLLRYHPRSIKGHYELANLYDKIGETVKARQTREMLHDYHIDG